VAERLLDDDPAEAVALLDWLLQRTYYQPGDFRSPDSYARLAARLREVDEKHRTQARGQAGVGVG